MRLRPVSPTPWGKVGLSNKEDTREGSEDRVEYRPLLYQILREASVSGDRVGRWASLFLYPHRRAHRSTKARSCSIVTEAFRKGRGKPFQDACNMGGLIIGFVVRQIHPSLQLRRGGQFAFHPRHPPVPHKSDSEGK